MCVKDRFKNWRDLNVRLSGPVVLEMSSAFDRMWHRATAQKPLPKRIKSRDPEFRYVTNFPAPGRRHVYAELVEAIRSARKYIYITTPYFVPSRRLARVLKLAAHRGIDVKIIIPEKSDHYAVDLGARSYFETLMESGVRIYLYTGNMIHSKAIVIDGEWASVGSMNLDRVSMFYNFEANIITRNSKFAEELVAHFVHDMHEAKEVDFHLWKNRFFVEKLPEKAITIVRKFL
jgi:cardiolipin synthase